MTKLRIPLLLPVLAGALLALSGCITLPREDGPPAAPFDAFVTGFPSSVRVVGIDPHSSRDVAAKLKALRKASDGTLDFLALSGGGAGGSYGAGIMQGMTKTGKRPQFEVVTGVSSGALIAPFAFLGSEWDDELGEAFATEAASSLLQSRGFGILFKPSFFKGEPLEEMVDRFVTEELMEAVARESEKGRVLLVATTDLDIQQPVYWDMGEIARRRNDRARTLFKNVLIASASVPGVFPPVMIPVEANGKTYEEMHVDGGATIPFFLGPELWSLWSDPLSELKNANIYIVINGQLQAPSSSTPVNTIQVVARSFESMMIYAARIAISEYASASEQHDMNFHLTYIPTDLAFAGPLDFDTGERQRLFNYAKTCSQQDLVWVTADSLADALKNSLVTTADLKVNFGIPTHCPIKRQR